MKLRVFSFAFAILLLSNSSFGSISDSAESTTPCTLKNGDLKAITTISGKAIEVLKVNRTYKVEAPNNCSTDTLFLFLNNIRVAKLIPNHGHDFHFTIGDVGMDSKRPLYEILSVDEIKDEAEVSYVIGKTYTDKLLNGTYKIDYVSTKDQVAKWLILVAALVICFISVWTLMRDQKAILRDSGTTASLPPFSLARTQMAFWTIIVLLSILWIWYSTGQLVSITTQVLVLLGISAGTTVTANIIDKDDLQNTKIKKRHQEDNSSQNFFLNIVSDQKGLSIHRFQNVIFSVAIGLYFLYEVIKNNQIPVLNENLMVLMGISSGTYLAIKKTENSTKQAEEDDLKIREEKEKGTANNPSSPSETPQTENKS